MVFLVYNLSKEREVSLYLFPFSIFESIIHPHELSRLLARLSVCGIKLCGNTQKLWFKEWRLYGLYLINLGLWKKKEKRHDVREVHAVNENVKFRFVSMMDWWSFVIFVSIYCEFLRCTGFKSDIYNDCNVISLYIF